MGEPIRFYKIHDPYGGFSNFAPYPIHIDGKEWPTTEHYFQAQKFVGTPYEESIRTTASPMIAARLGRSRKQPIRKDWEIVKDAIMEKALQAKFEQHTDLAKQLLETGDSELIEHTSKDSYWGDGGDGSGLNKLGQALMTIRIRLRQKDATNVWSDICLPENYHW